tara:strand:+ start:32150 stop:32308 length:159 start_codon:yes stop_codon:yes gene_type:complete
MKSKIKVSNNAYLEGMTKPKNIQDLFKPKYLYLIELAIFVIFVAIYGVSELF